MTPFETVYLKQRASSAAFTGPLYIWVFCLSIHLNHILILLCRSRNSYNHRTGPEILENLILKGLKSESQIGLYYKWHFWKRNCQNKNTFKTWKNSNIFQIKFSRVPMSQTLSSLHGWSLKFTSTVPLSQTVI